MENVAPVTPILPDVIIIFIWYWIVKWISKIFYKKLGLISSLNIIIFLTFILNFDDFLTARIETGDWMNHLPNFIGAIIIYPGIYLVFFLVVRGISNFKRKKGELSMDLKRTQVEK